MFVALLFLLMVTAVAFSFLRDERPVTRILVYAGIAAAITLMALSRGEQQRIMDGQEADGHA